MPSLSPFPGMLAAIPASPPFKDGTLQQNSFCLLLHYSHCRSAESQVSQGLVWSGTLIGVRARVSAPLSLQNIYLMIKQTRPGPGVDAMAREFSNPDHHIYDHVSLIWVYTVQDEGDRPDGLYGAGGGHCAECGGIIRMLYCSSLDLKWIRFT